MHVRPWFPAIVLAMLFFLNTVSWADEPASRSAPLTVSLSKLAESPVGNMHCEVPGWTLLETRSQRVSTRLNGEWIELVVDWPADSELPARLRWSKESRPGEENSEKIAWRQLTTDYHRTEIKLPDPLPRLQLTLLNAGELTAAWFGAVCFEARFEIEGRAQVAWLVDGNFDGTLGGPLDRWIAGPSEIVENLPLFNPNEELRTLQEAWCIGPESLAYEAHQDGAVVIQPGPILDRSELLREHYDRVQSEFEAKLPPRSLLLKGQGEDPDRPAAGSPMRWRYVHLLADAKLLARAEGRPLLVEFTSFSCGFCRLLSHVTHEDEEVDGLLRRFTSVRIIHEIDPVAEHASQGVGGFPCTVVYGLDGEEVGRIEGFKPPSQFAGLLNDLLDAADEH